MKQPTGRWEEDAPFRLPLRVAEVDFWQRTFLCYAQEDAAAKWSLEDCAGFADRAVLLLRERLGAP